MAIFKCKICGGALEVDGLQSVATCEYCGSKQTLPKLDDERRANLYDRANHFRRNNDFDKAMGMYESILNEDTADSEAYWSIVLCRYGIEYVEDPTTRKRVPTVNRAQFTSIFDDEDYKSAVKNADPYQREIYEAEAAAINEIQKGILEISEKEEPFDVFICYKETDERGRRTQDSVLATELYHELTREGYKVFFSRITLEDKLGVAYEPYIFAALNSARVMVAIGTRPEHFNSVWVKNEWSRYLALIKNGARKTLIPAYRDMDPYDLPDEFSHLQAQDMSKLGFMQDLTRGVEKILHVESKKETVSESTVTIQTPQQNVSPLLKRAFLFLEDGEFERADEFCENILNLDPENAKAYVCKLMVDLKVRYIEDLKQHYEPIAGKRYYEKALRFADPKFAEELREINDHIILELNTSKYEESLNSMRNASTSADYKRAAIGFEKISDFKDSKELAEQCYLKVAEIEEAERIEVEKYHAERRRIYELRRSEREKKAKRLKKIQLIVALVVFAVVSLIILITAVFIPMSKYDNAISEMNMGNYSNAIQLFGDIEGYKDSSQKRSECIDIVTQYYYDKALVFLEVEQYDEAVECFNKFKGFEQSENYIYAAAKKLYENGEAYEAYYLLESAGLEGVKEGYYSVSLGNYAQAVKIGLVDLIIPNGVTSVSYDDFIGCEDLYGIVLPRGLKSIGNGAFRDCTNLTEITINDGVTVIEEGTFQSCINLKKVVLPNSIVEIEAYAFSKCDNLVEINIPNGVTAIGVKAFEHCISLKKIELPDGMKEIASGAFFGCQKLVEITMPESLTSIGTSAFFDCDSLESITIPQNVISIGEYAFSGCRSLRSITFADTSTWYASEDNSTDDGVLYDVTMASPSDFVKVYKSWSFFKK